MLWYDRYDALIVWYWPGAKPEQPCSLNTTPVRGDSRTFNIEKESNHRIHKIYRDVFSTAKLKIVNNFKINTLADVQIFLSIVQIKRRMENFENVLNEILRLWNAKAIERTWWDFYQQECDIFFLSTVIMIFSSPKRKKTLYKMRAGIWWCN